MASNGFTLLTSTIMLGLLVKSLIHKSCVDILLYTNSYIGIFGYSLFVLMDNIDMFKGDYGLFVEEQTSICRIRGYMVFVFSAAVRYALALQVSHLKFFSMDKK